MKKVFNAVVLLSGGVDSALCLLAAIKKHGADRVAAMTFNYGQRHIREIDSSIELATDQNIFHKVLEIPFIKEITQNELVSSEDSSDSQLNQRKENGDVATLVMGRNGLFLRIAAIYAHHLSASELYIGINELDSVNYRDCSRDYIDQIESILKIDLNNNNFKIVTPISGMTKEQTMELADKWGVLDYLLEKTVTCYKGIPREGCGICLACQLRREGLERYRRSRGL